MDSPGHMVIGKKLEGKGMVMRVDGIQYTA